MQVKDFQRIVKFSGGALGEAQWRMWAMDMKMIINSVHPSLVKVLNMVEASRNKNEVNGIEAERVLVEEQLEDEYRGLQAKSTELYEIVYLLTDGEAKLLIMSAAGGDGVRAWQLLPII